MQLIKLIVLWSFTLLLPFQHPLLYFLSSILQSALSAGIKMSLHHQPGCSLRVGCEWRQSRDSIHDIFQPSVMTEHRSLWPKNQTGPLGIFSVPPINPSGPESRHLFSPSLCSRQSSMLFSFCSTLFNNHHYQYCLHPLLLLLLHLPLTTTTSHLLSLPFTTTSYFQPCRCTRMTFAITITLLFIGVTMHH